MNDLKNNCSDWKIGSQMSVWMKQQVSWTVKEQFPGHVSAEFLCPDPRVSCRSASWMLAAADEAKQWGNRVEKDRKEKQQRSSLVYRLRSACSSQRCGKKKNVSTQNSKLGVRTERAAGCGQEVLPLASALMAARAKTPGGNLLWWRHFYSNTTKALVVVYTQQTRTLKLQPNTSNPLHPVPRRYPSILRPRCSLLWPACWWASQWLYNWGWIIKKKNSWKEGKSDKRLEKGGGEGWDVTYSAGH